MTNKTQKFMLIDVSSISNAIKINALIIFFTTAGIFIPITKNFFFNICDNRKA